ncbi:uncharacterized protein LOC111086942 [Limulus polyphemus]|uniref:Uncharacterized protein LOC111086942 n=1 Tax=Limulus polyphemus TaxID=6850 RepID=A0ABM1SV95_LIMPO|nr:uncharacterized protein LOC111086942 [Limulus polyphemus]
MMQIEHDVLASEEVKDKVKKRTKDLIMSQATTVLVENDTSSDEEDIPSQNVPQLFAGYKRSRHWGGASKTSVSSQLKRYFEMCQEHHEGSPNAYLHFWLINKNNLSRLFPVAMRVLTVPTSSSPIERVFSYGGIIMCPHRAKLSDKMLSQMIFLKYNSLYR